MKSKLSVALAAAGCAFVLSVGPARAGPFYEFTTASTATDTQLSLGFMFTVNGPVSVSALGYFDHLMNGFATPHNVGIFNSSGTLLTSALLSSGTVNPLTGNFRYTDISPITLAAGTYTIAATTNGDQDPWAYGNAYGPGTTPPSFGTITGFTVDPLIIIALNAALYVYQSDNVLRNPTEHFGDYTIYAGPNALIAPVPIPAALPLFATGLGALGLLVWRRKRKAVAA